MGRLRGVAERGHDGLLGSLASDCLQLMANAPSFVSH